MFTYYVTLAIVLAICLLAEYFDYAHDNSINYGRVRHSGTTLLFYAIAMITLAYVSGSRFFVGTDFGAYYADDSTWDDVIEKLKNFDEPGFYFVSYVGRLIWDTKQSSIMAAAFATIVPAMIVFYRNTDRLTIVTLLFVFDSWCGSFNGVRQYLAATILFLGYSFVRDKKLWKYALIVFLAFLVHRSAAVMIIPYFIVHWKVDWKRLLVILGATVIVLLSYEKLFDLAGWVMNEEAATDAYAQHVVNKWRVAAGCAPAVFFIIAYWKKNKSEAENFYINLLIIHAAVRLVSMNSAFLYRVGIYTSLFQSIAIAELLKGFSEGNRKPITFIIMILFGILWWWEVVNGESLNPFVWYK